jgi:threonine/homoserine/homoserine lactone efflux protein
MDVAAMSAYGLGGSAIAARMSRPAFRRGFAAATGVLLLAAAALILARD